MFETNPKQLKELLDKIHDGRLQLPDFQRDWVWSDEGIRSLLASIAAGFPVGALLTLTTGGEVRFKPRPLEHAPDLGVEPEELLLDGQQRMTSCYQALVSQQPVQTQNSKGRPLELFYFMDIKAAVEGSARLDSCIRAVPADGVQRTDFNRTVLLDLSTVEKQVDAHMFPLNRVFDEWDWLSDYQHRHNEEGYRLGRLFRDTIIKRLNAYQLPIIKLTKDNSREAVCTVFEKVNVGGQKLDAFELLTAMFAADEFDLRADMRGDDNAEGRLARIRGHEKDGVFRDLSERDVLQVAALLQTYDDRMAAIDAGVTDPKKIPAVSIRAEALLELRREVYQDKADAIERGFVKARQFLGELHIRRAWEIPYLPSAKALAAVFVLSSGRELNLAARKRLERWFWCISLGESYGASTDTKIARDVLELLPWLEGGEREPRAIEEISIRIDRLDRLRSRIAAGYKAVNAALLDEGCLDFRTGKRAYQMTQDDDPIDIHHVFPQDWCKRNGVEKDRYDTVVNKTPLSRQTNQIVGAQAPSRYLGKLAEELTDYEQDYGGEVSLDDVIASHLIDPAFLKADDFDAFYAARKEALARLIERKTGIRIVRGEEEQEGAPEIDQYAEAAA